MYAGIDFIFKNETALNLLSPEIIWNDLNPVFLTVIGCIIPNCSIELANWDILSFSKFVLGWKGFVLIWSIGISITLLINLSAFESWAELISLSWFYNNAESPLPSDCFLFALAICVIIN